ncbi:purine-cytosine permease [Piedraia hortae CBS 480.64]|uniref:Purine-cytosine permease n=1 Tax=Piedraia hortae CBS 480.64 TaxID=1314780 RepID=A0A6A7C5A4_9PEZI|nr:purine-cytosine permease [Piedraia hortae CBS 480.64]
MSNDVEKNIFLSAPEVDGVGAVRGEAFNHGTGIWARCMRVAGKFGVEQRGIERVPEDERPDRGTKALLNVFTMWFSANLVIPSFALGLLAKSIFKLGVVDAMLTVLFFNLIGTIPVCTFSTFGPAFGLRQMVLSRFYFGWWGVRLVAFFNVIACIGWSAVNSIIAAQLLHAVDNRIPGWVGIVIGAVCTLIITLFGYEVVHIYQFWSWAPALFIFIVILGVFAHTGDFQNLPMGTGEAEVGSVLSYGSVIFGFAIGWSSFAADYTVYQPATQSKKKVYFWTWLGVVPAMCFTQMLGIAVMSATAANGGDNRYQKGYDASGSGGIIDAIIVYHLGGFGKFCLVILALTVIATNCPNIYSVSLTVQVLTRRAQRVPRFLWTFVATICYVAIGIPAYLRFESVLHNFMIFIGYWLAIYGTIVLTDHVVFKRGVKGYRPEMYDTPKALPSGIAAVTAFCVGIVGMVAGISGTWWTGWIARAAGGDIGWETAAGFALVTYLIARPLELKWGR